MESGMVERKVLSLMESVGPWKQASRKIVLERDSQHLPWSGASRVHVGHVHRGCNVDVACSHNEVHLECQAGVRPVIACLKGVQTTDPHQSSKLYDKVGIDWWCIWMAD